MENELLGHMTYEDSHMIAKPYVGGVSSPLFDGTPDGGLTGSASSPCSSEA